MVGSGVRVGHEIANALELQVVAGLHSCSIRLDIAIAQHSEAVGIDDLLHAGHVVTVLLIHDGSQRVTGILHLPQAFVEPDFRLDGIMATDPMERLALDLAVGSGQSAACLGVVGAVDRGHVAVGILVAGVRLVAFDDIGILQAYLLARGKAHEFLLGHFHEVVALNPYLTAKFDGMCAVGLILWIVDSSQLFGLSLGIVGDDHLHRVEYGADADGAAVEVLAHGAFQQSHLIECIIGRVADLVDEIDDALRTVAAAAETTDGGHEGIVPTCYETLLH